MFSAMKEWFSLLLTAAAAASVCDIFVSSAFAKKQGIRKCFRFVIGLCVSCAVVLPVLSAVSGIRGTGDDLLDPYRMDAANSGVDLRAADEFVVSLTRSKLENELKNKLEQKFGINIPNVRIELYKKEKDGIIEVAVSHITVSLSKGDEGALSEITRQINDLLYCDAVVTIEHEE